jgi:hypothetical protein
MSIRNHGINIFETKSIAPDFDTQYRVKHTMFTYTDG